MIITFYLNLQQYTCRVQTIEAAPISLNTFSAQLVGQSSERDFYIDEISPPEGSNSVNNIEI